MLNARKLRLDALQSTLNALKLRLDALQSMLHAPKLRLDALKLPLNAQTSLLGKIADYEAIVAGPRNAITDRSTATSELEKLFLSGDDVLTNMLDKLLNQFTQSDPEFSTQYTSSRKIVDMGGAATGLKGKITDSSTGDRIVKATVELPELETDRKTNKDGMYHFKKVRPGTYALSASGKGYKTKEIAEVEIEEGRTNELDIELDRTIELPQRGPEQLETP